MRIAMVGLRAIGQTVPEDAGPRETAFLDRFSGVERAVEEISVRLAAAGHEVTVFCRARYNPQGALTFRGVALRNLPAIYTKHLEAISHTMLASLAAIKGYEVVHYHATGPALLSFLPRVLGTKTVVTVHGLDWQRAKWKGFAKVVLRAGAWAACHFPHRTIVVSKSLQNYYTSRYGRPTICIPNGVHPGQPLPPQRIRRFGVRGNDYILFLGRLVPEKGIHDLVDAFRSVPTEAKLLIAGGSSYSDDYLRELRARAQGDARIVFTGSLHGPDKAEAFSNALFFVLPSTLEGMPIAMLEAMSYGCPVLCSDILENVQVLRGEYGSATPGTMLGTTFRAGSVADLRLKIGALLANIGPAREVAVKAREHVLATFTWDRIAEQTARVYLSLWGA